MIANKNFIPSLGITFGVVGLTANALALTYCSGLSPLIMGGMIGSMLPLVGCVLVGALSLAGKREALDKAFSDNGIKCCGEHTVFPMAQAVVAFGIGAGFAALGLQLNLVSFLSVALAAMVVTAAMYLFSEKKQPQSPADSFAEQMPSNYNVDNHLSDMWLNHYYRSANKILL